MGIMGIIVGLIMVNNGIIMDYLFGGIPTPLKNKVSWDDYSQYYEKIRNVPHHQPVICHYVYLAHLTDVYFSAYFRRCVFVMH